jgi:hypothetical protein
MLYARPILLRSGLANRLFPWARCVVFSQASGVRMLAPRWAQVKIGPLLRRERDLRLYLGLFRRSRHEVAGPERWWALATLRRLEEPHDLRRPLVSGPMRGVVTFEGLSDFFARLDGHGDLLRSRLLEIARPDIVQHVSRLECPPIGIHVRRGDFREVPPTELAQGQVRTPLEWYVETLRQVRAAAGSTSPAFVVSDGDEAELAALLRAPDVRLVRTGTALGDLLLLTRARVLLGSQGSSFSAWGSFFGGAPVATVPGIGFDEEFQYRRAQGPYVGTFDPARPSPAFIEDAVRALTGAKHVEVASAR